MCIRDRYRTTEYSTYLVYSMQFQSVCSKWNQKLTLSLSANSIEEARALLHGQWYSIMEIQEISESSQKSSEMSAGNFFYFDAIINGLTKSWKIQSTDVFKAYKKLVDDLGYNILYIYTTEGMNEQQKKMITAKVKDGYIMYQQSLGIDTTEKRIQTEKEVDNEEISPQVLKAVSYTHLATICIWGPPWSHGKTDLSIFLAISSFSRTSMSPHRGPRRVLCVVEVMISNP